MLLIGSNRAGQRIGRLLCVGALLALGFVGSLFALHPASAAPTITIKVNALTDTNTADNLITLREAILLVNGGQGGNGTRTGLGRTLSATEKNQIVGGVIGATGVAANIVFTDLPGLPVVKISRSSGGANESLPPILTSGVVIDGLGGDGARVTIDGSSSPGDTDLLDLGTTNVSAVGVSDITIRSLVISGSKKVGINLVNARNVLISQCDVTRCTSYAILINSKFGGGDNNTVENCAVYDNGSLGIVVNRPGAVNNTIRNCRIGIESGTSPRPNTGAGIAFFSGANNNLITGNVISGNTLQGIFFYNPNTRNNLVYGNWIGVAANGTSALPNIQGIVFGDGATNNVVGGTAPGQANVIAFNTESGIVVHGSATTSNRISGNSIYRNHILGIDLLDDKQPTVGISGGGVGPNRLAMRPTLTLADVTGATVLVRGIASPNSTVELFIAEPHPSSLGSGRTYCATVTADASGAFEFRGSPSCLPGGAFTATSTLFDGSTSEFAKSIATSSSRQAYLPRTLR